MNTPLTFVLAVCVRLVTRANITAGSKDNLSSLLQQRTDRISSFRLNQQNNEQTFFLLLSQHLQLLPSLWESKSRLFCFLPLPVETRWPGWTTHLFGIDRSGLNFCTVYLEIPQCLISYTNVMSCYVLCFAFNLHLQTYLSLSSFAQFIVVPKSKF